MAKTNEQVAHLFAHRRAGDSNNMHSDGTELKSYSTVIAVWYGGVCFVSSDNMSPTTGSKHLSPLRLALRGQRVLYTPAFRWGRYGAPSVAECLQEAAKEMENLFKSLCRSRVHLDSRIEHYTKRRQEILQLAAEFNVDVPTMPEATGDLKEKAKQFAAQDRERRAEEKKRQEEETRRLQEANKATYTMWIEQGRGRFPASYRDPDTDFLTVRNGYTYDDFNDTKGLAPHLNKAADTVITSQGAEVPLEHVIKALRFYDSRKYTAVDINGNNPETAFNEYHTNGHKVRLGAFVLDEIDEQGNVRAGCHHFTAAEIARFRTQWAPLLKEDQP